jgi:hypothetical protein
MPKASLKKAGALKPTGRAKCCPDPSIERQRDRAKVYLTTGELHGWKAEGWVGEPEALVRVVVGDGGVVVVAQEIQVPHQGAAGDFQFTGEVAAVGERAGAGAFPNHLQDALKPVVLGASSGFHLFGPVPLDGT